MYVIYLLIFTVVVYGQDSEEEKYIDLLSDTEKEEFLESVARRISEKVVSKSVSNKTSLEIPDEDLNVHDAFVKQILKEEFDSRRDNKNSEKDIDENVKVEPIKLYQDKGNDTTKPDAVDDTANQDILDDTNNENKLDDTTNQDQVDDASITPTLNTKRLKRRDIAMEKSSEIPVEVVTELAHHLTSSLNMNTKVNVGSTEILDLPSVNKNESEVKFGNKTVDMAGPNININSTLLEHHASIMPEKLSFLSSGDGGKDPENVTRNELYIKSMKSPRSNNVTVEKTILTARNEDTISEKNPISSTVVSVSKDDADITSTVPHKGGNDTDYANSTTFKKPSFASDHSKENNEFKDILKVTDFVTSLNTTANAEKNSSEQATVSGVIQTLTSVANVAEQAINFLRSSLLLLEDDDDNGELDKINKKEEDIGKNKKGNVRTYEVREIRNNQLPFIKDSVTVNEKPYHVPVYNYSLDNAYFNPKNRYGPRNPDDYKDMKRSYNDVNNKFLVKRNNDKGLTKKKYNLEDNEDGSKNDENQNINVEFLDVDNEWKRSKHVKSVETAKKLNNFLTWPFYKKKMKSHVYNPNDYLDLDYQEKSVYYQGRMGSDKILPDSDEESHPYHSVPKNWTNHIRAVRNILYNKHHFLYERPLNTKSNTKSTRFNTSMSDSEMEFSELNSEEESGSGLLRSRSDKDNISLDYYFGRMTPEKNDMNVFVKNEGNGKNFVKINDKMTKYIETVQFKDEPYYDQGHIAATPHTDLKFDKEFQNTRSLTGKTSKAKRKTKNDEKNDSKEFEKISNILDMTNEADVFIVLERLIQLNISLSRRHDAYLNVYLKVLKDLVRTNDKALKQYDWLGTTVDILSAIRKLLELTESAQKEDYLHPSDLELLKFMILLQQLSEESVDDDDLNSMLRTLLPKNRHRKRHFLTTKGLINRVWLLRRNTSVDDCLNNFKVFLEELRNSLHDFHEAILNVALITRYSKQNWFENIKDLHMTPENMSYLQMLLHLVSARLFGLVEESATKGLERNFLAFLMDDQRLTIKILTEFIYVKRILDEIKQIE